jgi:hypothetical protein
VRTVIRLSIVRALMECVLWRVEDP